jgi:hypothetical protein
MAAQAPTAKAREPSFFHFRLCRTAGCPEPALGWQMSKESFDLIADQLDKGDCGNDIELQALLGILERE